MPSQPNTTLSLFSERIASLNQRIVAVQAQLAQLPPNPILDSAILELLTSVEILNVADEELHQQHEALLETTLQMEAEQNRYRDLFEFAPVGYLLTDAHGIIKEANHRATQVLNIERQFLLGKPLAVFFDEPERGRFRHKLNQLRAGHPLLAWETYLRPRRGRPIEVMLTVATTPHSPHLRWLIYNLDERKKLETAEMEPLFQSGFEDAAMGLAHLDLQDDWLRVNSKFAEILGYTREGLIQRPFYHTLYEDDKVLFAQLVRQVRDGDRGGGALEMRFHHASGSIIWGNVTLSLVKTGSGSTRYITVTLEDITKRKELEAVQHQHNILTEALTHTALALTSSLNIMEVFEHVLDNLHHVVPHQAAFILLTEKDKLVVRGFRGELMNHIEPEEIERFHVPFEDELRAVRENQQPAVFSKPLLKQYLAGFPREFHSLSAGLVAPILVGKQALGILIVLSHAANFFTPMHIRYIQVFAAQAGIAIRNAQVHEQEKKMVVEEHRHHLARELHDAVTQTLFASKLTAEALTRIWRTQPELLERYLGDLKTLNDNAIAEMRVLLLELRPAHLLNTSLSENLDTLATSLQGRRGLSVTVETEEAHPIPAETQVVLYRIAQEACNNIFKHARATQVHIHLSSTPQKLTLSVEDNGIGFDPESVSRGFGLQNMRERAEDISATLTLTRLQPGMRLTVEQVIYR